MSAVDENRLKEVRNQINKVDSKVNVAAGNGLFKNQTKVTFESIQDELHHARIAIDDRNISEAETQLSLGNSKFYEALHEADEIWRFSNLYAGHIWIYLIGFLVGIFFFYYLEVDKVLSSKDNFELMAIYAGTWGCIGGILRGFWKLKDKVDLRLYQNSWIIYFLSTPFLGGIFGVIIYFIIIGGLVSVSQQQFRVDNIFVILPFSALAGYNWEWAIDLFKKISDLASPTSKKEEK